MSTAPPMKFGQLPNVTTPISRIVLGTYGLHQADMAAPVLDAYFAAGGNCADTAFLYNAGESERVLGDWMERRGTRKDFVVITKGAHTPLCFPETIGDQLDVSLDRLRTDHVEIYMLHRDNPDVPVGEFVAALAREVQRGRVQAVGVSNWRIDRLVEANAWARANGAPEFVCLSNNFGLAEMLAPPWPGCISASDPESRAWLEAESFALFPWTSQAQGFFSPEAIERVRVDDAFRQSWWDPDNAARRDRAQQLAADRGTSAVAVALAYVLGQRFPTFPLVGPTVVEQLLDSLSALDVTLADDDVAWLADGELRMVQ